MQREQSALESRFGLRLVAVFALCAVAPVVLFAGFAYLRTLDQLESEAAVALEREAKAAAMSIAERLHVAAAELAIARLQPEEDRSGAGKAFSRLSVRATAELSLTDTARRHLRRGGTLFIERISESRFGPFLLASFEADHVLMGELLPAFLYQPNRVDSQTRYWVMNADGDLLFADGSDGRTAALLRDVRGMEDRVGFRLETPTGSELAVVWPLFIEVPFGSPGLRVGIARPRDAILRPLEEFRSSFLPAVMLALLGSTAIGLRQVRYRVRPLNELMQATRAVAGGDYSTRVHMRSGDEFDDLGKAFNSMAREIALNVSDLRELASAGMQILSDPDLEAVAQRLADSAMRLTGARLAAVFIAQPVSSQEPGSSPRQTELAPLLATSGDGSAVSTEGLEHLVTGLANMQPLLDPIRLLERESAFDDTESVWSQLEEKAGGRLDAVLTVPLASAAEGARGLLLLAASGEGAEVLRRERTRSTLQILADQGAASFRIAELIASLRNLFEGVIHLTVEAIDEKSPYTGDHCRRVPILTELIADAVCNGRQGPLKDFTLSEEERYELKIAALLHDCGKVATPVHVMDKATKLEAIGDRIELVRARTEILWRDLELGRLREAISAAGASIPPEDPALRSARAALESDLAFIERHNSGGEFMATASKERIDAIRARYDWRDRHGEHHALLTPQETENLKISRGTLNPEERRVIEQHVTTTIRLLEQLPFPAEMRNVPFIAGAHHEHLDGSGYPNGLGGEQLSMQARILGLADVFEALTARDRPYKPGRTLSETLRILDRMVVEGHLDADLHAVFLRSKIHLRYAAKHLDPSQIDSPHQAELEALTAPWADGAA